MNIENQIEFDQVKNMWMELAVTEWAKEKIRDVSFYLDESELRKQLHDTTNSRALMEKLGTPPLQNLTEIKDIMMIAEKGDCLTPYQLERVQTLLAAIRRMKDYLERGKIYENPLAYYEENLDTLEELRTEISTQIRGGMVDDHASKDLSQIRSQMAKCEEDMKQKANRVMRSHKDCMADHYCTKRNGRLCVPVKKECKLKINGSVIDRSATRNKIFMEPTSVAKCYEELQTLTMREENEIYRILYTLTALVAASSAAMNENIAMIEKLDFIFSKGKLSMEMNAVEPSVNTQRRIVLKDARHPLMDSSVNVPLQFSIEDKIRGIVITGPNTGGKTVSLKTVGLFTLMGQAGLHIPAFDGSELAVFEEVFADIGDEQSIEQSLSTFSSHMKTIISILERASENSLVLFDELGAGTDPTEGAALAISILSNLHRRGARTMATTHYSELKVFALSTPGVENGCCEFDVETLRPTYRLLIGVPGKSNAFAISSKLGLSDEIIEEAKTHLSEQDERFEDLITSLENSRVTIEREREEIDRYKQEIHSLKQRLEQKQDKLENSREDILRKAREEARAILQDAKDYADTTIRNFNKFGKENISAKEMEKERERLRKKLSGVEKNLTLKAEKKPKKELSAKDLKIGDGVKVLSMNLKGTVSTLPNGKGNLYVQMGILRSQVNIKGLELLDEPDITGPGVSKSGGGSGKIKMSKSASVGMELNLLGKTVDEAIAELDKYLDDAYLAHMPSVRIVHGKGTGALRKGVHNYLRRNKHVKSFRLGEFGEGDAGVTIVEFRQ